MLNVMSFSNWASITSTSSNPDAALPIVCRFTQPCLTCFSLAHKIDGTKKTRGAHVKILTGMLVLFFGFGIWPNPIFLGWQIFSYFSGFRKKKEQMKQERKCKLICAWRGSITGPQVCEANDLALHQPV